MFLSQLNSTEKEEWSKMLDSIYSNLLDKGYNKYRSYFNKNENLNDYSFQKRFKNLKNKCDHNDDIFINIEPFIGPFCEFDIPISLSIKVYLEHNFKRVKYVFEVYLNGVEQLEDLEKYEKYLIGCWENVS